MGPPGAGKGTHAGLLAKYTDGIAISAGAVIRECIARGQKKDERIINLVGKGKMIPHVITYSLMFPEIKKAMKKYDTVILDGILRTSAQIYSYWRLFKELPEHRIIIFYLDTPDSLAQERLLKRKRSDDAIKTLQTRFQIQGSHAQKRLLPILKKRAQVYIVNSARTILEVEKDLETLLDSQYAQRHDKDGRRYSSN